jgi:dihydroxy-acid dehydratase
MTALRSNFPIDSALAVVRRAEWAALGIPGTELDKPKIAIVNSSSDLAACFAHLDGIVPVLKRELRALGVLPFEVRTAAPSDFITSAGRGGRYILPTRDLMVNDIEVVVDGAQLDGMICLSSCDKTTPAHLMAAGRLDIPTVIVPCGYQSNGRYEDGTFDIEDVFLHSSHHAIGSGAADAQRDVEAMADGAIRGPGVCAGLATANSMHMVAEALGMAVPGSAPVRANSERMWASVRRAAAAMAGLVERGLRPRRIITNESISNAVRLMLAVGGSINTIKHLQAIALESGLDIDVWGAFRELARTTPVLASVRPNGPHLTEQFEDAGGAAVVLKELMPILNGEQLTITDRTLAENAEEAAAADGTVIRPFADPVTRDPSILVVRGSLCDSAVVKRPIPDPGPRRFRGPARVFHSREEGVEAIRRGEVKPGDVPIIRGIGLGGGPGMGMTSAFIFALEGAGLDGKVAFVTDGQLSGLVNTGIVVGEVSPEAAAGGPLGLVRDGDLIDIDLAAGTVDLLVDKQTLDARPPFEMPHQNETSGYLEQYRATVQPLACGAVLCARRGIGE